MTTKFATWLLAGAIVAGAGCAGGSNVAQAQQQPTPPAPAAPEAPAPEAAENDVRMQAEREAARAARDAARDAGRAQREAAVRLREVAGELARAREGEARVALRAAARVKKEKAAYLGVTTSQVSGALREHLKLPRGFGLVVDSVEDESAAAAAGVQRFDILQKLNDQLLVNSQQLSVLIRSMKPGDEVRLTLLRGGQAQEVTARLTEKEVPVLSDGSWGWTEDEGFGNGFNFVNVPAPLPPVAVSGVLAGPQGDKLKFFTSDKANTSVYQDKQMTLTITEDDEGKTLVAKDLQGQQVFEGPINDDAQRQKMPKDVADRLARFEEKLAKMPVERGRGMTIRVIENDD